MIPAQCKMYLLLRRCSRDVNSRSSCKQLPPVKHSGISNLWNLPCYGSIEVMGELKNYRPDIPVRPHHNVQIAVFSGRHVSWMTLLRPSLDGFGILKLFPQVGYDAGRYTAFSTIMDFRLSCFYLKIHQNIRRCARANGMRIL